MPMRLVLATLLVTVAACGTTTKATNVAEDERGSVGVPPGAVGYCEGLGFTVNADSACVFPDGTSCEEWSFYRGTCGQSHSYCNQHGGSISSRIEDAGTWTAVYAVCARDGKECHEADFVDTGTCE